MEKKERKLYRPGEGKAVASGLASKTSGLPVETLVVVSKLKNFIKESSGYNCSSDVNDWLSDHIRKLCLEAAKNARAAGRKTVMARDFEG